MKRRTFSLAALSALSLANALSAQEASNTPRVPDVSLLDQQGRAVRLSDLVNGRTVAINFIYTGCASFCPPQTAVFRALQSRLGELSQSSAKPLLLSLSLDPLNDTPQALVQYASRFDAKLGMSSAWLMLTGEVAAMEKAVRAFGTSSVRIDDHPAQVWVGCQAKSRWLRTAGLASADDLLRMMKTVAA